MKGKAGKGGGVCKVKLGTGRGMRGRGEGVCHRNSCHPVKPCSPSASGFRRHLLCALKQTHSPNSTKQTKQGRLGTWVVGTTRVKLVLRLAFS